jgi:hypothetical protein
MMARVAEWVSSCSSFSDKPLLHPSLKVEAGGMEGGWIDFDLEAIAAMTNVTEVVVDVMVMGSLAVHVMMIGVLVVNFQLVVDVFDETGVLVHNRGVLVLVVEEGVCWA